MSSEKIKVEIEICSNCKSHQWCTRHKEENYSALAIDTKRLIESKDPSIDVEIFQVGGTAMGSFEIICKETVLFSKLKFGYFPHVPSAVTRVIEFIDDFRNGRDLKKYSEARSISPHKTMISSTSNGFKEKSSSTSSPKIAVKRVKYDPNSQQTKKEENNSSKDEKLTGLHNKDTENKNENDSHEQKKEENLKKEKTETKQSEKEIPTQNKETPKEVKKESDKNIPNNSQKEINNETDTKKDSSKHITVHQNNENKSESQNEGKPEELVKANFILKEEEKQEPQQKIENQLPNEEKFVEAPKNETNAQNSLNEINNTEKQEEAPETKILTENEDKKIE